MTKEEEIREMARRMCRNTQSCNDVCHPIKDCNAFKYAERAYDAGCRLQSEVVKVVVREFIDELEDVIDRCPRDNGEMIVRALLELKKKLSEV